MLNILISILLFGVIVFIHELGHFLFAKWNGIGVIEFSIGMGPRFFTFVKGETRYSLKVFPFGGSCMMVGEDTEDSDPRAFHKKTPLARISVIAAGPIFNFILAFFFAVIIVWNIGHNPPIITGTVEGLPAVEAGLEAGDRIIKLNNRSIVTAQDVSTYLMMNMEQDVLVTYERPENGQWTEGATFDTFTTTITPAFNEEYNSYMIGIQLQSTPEVVRNPVDLIYYSGYEVMNTIRSTFDSLKLMFSQRVEVDEAVAGPVRIVSIVSETVDASRESGIGALITMLSYWGLMLSASLGILNLLPIPALDGGRLVFLFIELVRGKPIDPSKEGMVHMIGMILLMILMVVVLVNDIQNLF